MSRWLIGIPVWGEKYVRNFVDICLPFHRAALNGFPHEVHYVVHTDEPGAIWPNLPEGSDVLPVPDGSGYQRFGACHAEVLAMAQPGDRVSLMCADMIISRECFFAAEKRFEQGYKAVCWLGHRTAATTYPTPGISAAGLNRWAMENTHQIIDELFFGTGRSKTPSIIYFRKGGSIVMRPFGLGPFAVVKDRDLHFVGTMDNDLAARYKHDEIHVVQDCNEMSCAEISDPDKNFGTWDRPLNEDHIAAWASQCTNDINRWFFTHSCRIVGDEYCGDAEVAQSILDRIPYYEAHFLQKDYEKTMQTQFVSLFKSGRYVDLEAKARELLEKYPESGLGLKALGTTLRMQNKNEEALPILQRAAEYMRDDPQTQYNAGVVLHGAQRFHEAIECYQRSLELKPKQPEVLNNLANALKAIGKPYEALEHYQHALQIDSTMNEIHVNMANDLLTLGRYTEAVERYEYALKIAPEYIDAHNNMIFAKDLMVGQTTETLQAERRRWDEKHAKKLRETRAHMNNPDPDRKLRIGYVSADFREHSASKGFGGMLTAYDKSRFDVYCYANILRKEDKLTELFRDSVTHWRDISGLTDNAASKIVRDDEIDILVDLSGFSGGNRLLLFARKPAPIQITAWGYATGTGMGAMDAMFSDRVLIPEDERRHYVEEVRYLPVFMGAFFHESFPEVSESPALLDGIVTFGSFNRLAKVTEETMDVWARILHAVPKSRLVVKDSDLTDPHSRDRIGGFFGKRGIAPERIVLQGGTTWDEHMLAFGQIDIALNPFPQGAVITAIEGLMMGVPLIALRWPTLGGRSSVSILTLLGMTDWIAETEEQYVAIAVEKAKDIQGLAALRANVAGMVENSILGDAEGYARLVEAEYRDIWRKWCDQKVLDTVKTAS